jgi:hypothetical protein
MGSGFGRLPKVVSLQYELGTLDQPIGLLDACQEVPPTIGRTTKVSSKPSPVIRRSYFSHTTS